MLTLFISSMAPMFAGSLSWRVNMHCAAEGTFNSCWISPICCLLDRTSLRALWSSSYIISRHGRPLTKWVRLDELVRLVSSRILFSWSFLAASSLVK